jgi:YfiH family protein
VYAFRATTGPVDLAFTDRFGGVSGVPYDELNLAAISDDDPASCAENHRLLLDDFAPGDELADLHQVHGADVVRADPGAPRPHCDGVVTDRAGVVLLVRAADCVPVLLADPAARVVGAAHAGRKGVVAGVVPATVERMRELGARRIEAWIGPHICGRCYEVPAALQAEVAAVAPASVSTTSWGTPALDLGAGVRAQLDEAGVTVHQVGGCTRESADLYSYRREGAAAGRQAGLVRIRR